MIKASKFTVLFSGICALILTMGVARYSFTPMIPYLQDQTGMSASLAGWLAGWNYIGYMAGLFLVWLMDDLKVKDFFYRYGLFIAVFTTAIMAFHDHTLVWYMSRFFGGIATAFGFMLGSGLVLKWLLHNGYRTGMGTHFVGIGLGIVLTALVVDFASSFTFNGESWRIQWLALAAFGMLVFIPAILLMPFPTQSQIDEAQQDDRSHEPSKKWLTMLTISYFCAGFSNTTNNTFTSLMAEYVPLEGQGTFMWVMVGVAAIPAAIIWLQLAYRITFFNSIRIAFVINIISNLLLIFMVNYVGVLLSSLLYGFSFIGIVALTLTIIGRRYRHRATKVMAQLTLFYCIAQVVSPIVTGEVAEKTGSFNSALYLVSGIMVLGLICLLLIKREPVPTTA